MGTDKTDIEQVEEADVHSSRKLSMANAKGDRALALIGDEHISLTDEDVSRVVIVSVSG